MQARFVCLCSPSQRNNGYQPFLVQPSGKSVKSRDGDCLLAASCLQTQEYNLFVREGTAVIFLLTFLLQTLRCDLFQTSRVFLGPIIKFWLDLKQELDLFILSYFHDYGGGGVGTSTVLKKIVFAFWLGEWRDVCVYHLVSTVEGDAV